ncbi:MAG: aminotransferase class V-fold PLP-dependent enzyme, partial [Clostridia bacterium]|nr:aminotransferase class V-fold PLP-dependent enzyme [Clostridia bacterium]
MNKNMKEIIYFDNAATTRTDDDAAAIALKMMTECYANPSSAHSFGFEAERYVKEARDKIVKALGFKNTDGTLIFTASGTESDNMAVRGAVKTNARKGKHIVISDSEHPAVESTVSELEKEGYTVSRIPTKGGKLDMEFAEKAMTKDTVLVSCMTINNETGAIFDVSGLKRLASRLCPAAYFHTDAVQAFTKLKSFAMTGADMISISGHKIHAPKGVGALWVKKGIRIPALITGGGQEGGLRSGTEAVPAICAFGLAAEKAMKTFEEDKKHIATLGEYMR